MPKGKGYGRKKSGNPHGKASNHPNSKVIVGDGKIAGKKVKTPRTRRPAPPKHDPK